MRSNGWVIAGAAAFGLWVAPCASARHLHGHGGVSVGCGAVPGQIGIVRVPMAVGPVPWVYWPPYYATVGPGGCPVLLGPPVVVTSPPAAQPVPLGGPMPAPPAPAHAAARPRKPDPNRAGQLQTFGDRLFRAGNYKRAQERYEQAARLDPGAAGPIVRLGQLAVVRGQYAEAAARYRAALDAEPGWLLRAPDIQPLYAEPRDFQRTIATLESHLLVDPNDRDAWLALGAQLYLGGQTRRAADVFLRLSDRQPDPLLAAFRDAARPAN